MNDEAARTVIFLLSPKVRWVFAPDGSFPFENGVSILMSLEPGFSPVEQVKKFGVARGFFKLSIRFLLLNPADGRS